MSEGASNIARNTLSRLNVALKREKRFFRCSNFKQLHQRKYRLLNTAWRRRICQWCLSVVNVLGLPRKCVYLSMSILDLYLASSKSFYNKDPRSVQIITMAALRIVTKVGKNHQISTEKILKMSRGAIETNEILRTETDIMKSTFCNLIAHTPSCFIKIIMSTLHKHVDSATLNLLCVKSFENEMRVLCERSCIEHLPSVVAAVSVLDALKESTNILPESTYLSVHQMLKPMLFGAISGLDEFRSLRTIVQVGVSENANGLFQTPSDTSIVPYDISDISKEVSDDE